MQLCNLQRGHVNVGWPAQQYNTFMLSSSSFSSSLSGMLTPVCTSVQTNFIFSHVDKAAHTRARVMCNRRSPNIIFASTCRLGIPVASEHSRECKLQHTRPITVSALSYTAKCRGDSAQMCKACKYWIYLGGLMHSNSELLAWHHLQSISNLPKQVSICCL